ncbi:unnamed protein product [Moneuplotes crassus]|uniref:RING-type E3 ubiquitin transferase n=1 Tax=Euplotes crassus TaxID=5936 RepID=A0AAD2D4V3_EUPCR|nr:unnamed protein product [Moneuplotes crassus]
MEGSKDYECSVCLNVLVLPVATKCGHVFCKYCIHGYLETSAKKQCPMCRTPLRPTHFHPKVIKSKWEEIQSMYPEEIKDRYEAVREKEEEENKNMTVWLKFGNTYEELKEFTSRGVIDFKHKWSLYVQLQNKKIDPKCIIKKVEFDLEDPSGTTTIKKNFPPYRYNCIGYGTFSTPITITFQFWTKLEPMKIDHFLSFEKGGLNRSVAIKLDKEMYKLKVKAADPHQKF